MILSLIVILLSIIFLFFKNISVSINLFDLPDGVRKFQKDKVSCIGGIYFYFCL